MTLHVHRSERADPLVAALGELLNAPTTDPFAPELVAVPSRGVERWLAQQLSHILGAVDGDGVCANVVFPSSDRLLDDAVAAADGAYAAAVEQWSPERVVWPLRTVIADAAATQPWAAMLAFHLGLEPGQQDRGRRYAVAAKFSRHFASYAQARPAMLRAWHAGRDELGDGTPLPADLRWEAELWRRVRAEVGPSPAELLEAACAKVRSAPVDLPARFSVFGTTRITPVRIAVLTALAEHHEIHLWLHHPSPALWNATKGKQPGRRADDTATARHPLLASLSRDIRELQQLLPRGEDVHHPVDARRDTLLGQLQQQLTDDTVAPARKTDRSLTVHACHGPTRQVEVLREVVLGLLAADPTLEPRDILIMCPDVETFAPLVAASFGMADEPGGHPAGQLRVRLADRSLRQTNPLFSLLGQLLELAANRVTATQLLDVAGAPPVRALFGFSDDDLEQLRDWTAAANARWGLDAQHRTPYGLGGLSQGTWRAAVDRLLLGVAMEEGDTWLGTVLPLDDVDSGDIDLAGRLAELLDRVDTAVRAIEQPRSVPSWMVLLGDLVLSIGEPAQGWQAIQLRSELADIAEAASDTDVELSRADIAALLHTRLAGRPTRASFRTGTLTVCTLVPMRSVPHRVVCLLGLDDGAFPRQAVVDGDDVLARDPRTGERDVRSEDRQLFLDAICAAQEHLVITYTGADPRSGAEVPPCVPLGELLDVVGPGVVVRHPLQTFDVRNFTPHVLGTPGPFSFDPAGLAGARAAATTRRAPNGFLSGELPPAERQDVVDLDDLIKFVGSPMREFLKQRLQISTWQDDDEPADALPVDVGGLPEWAIGTRLLHDRLAGMPVETCQEMEYRRGDLPPGELGRRVLSSVGSTVEALVSACAPERVAPARSVDVALPMLDGRMLAGTVGGLYGSVLLTVTYSSFGPRLRLESWLRYLALVVATEDPTLQAVCVGRRQGGARRQVVRGIDPVEASGVLTDLVALRDAGLRAPLPLPLKTSAAYAERRYDDRGTDDALGAARSRWQDGQYPGECSDAAPVLILGGKVPLSTLTAFDPTGHEHLRFEPLAVRLWTPLLSAEHPR
ncbi:exodeoxyribonuclease V subunit gamma [uncultured Jatrophihabitans sp.]|uniref:exodeoxyribonuclease V subunit gamma n=1 Tax=uncultured Jatrophihabitans sp. TaxID=1610747 RepID=UPI0035CB9E1E